MAEQDPPRTLAKIDATKHTKLADRLAVTGFPTLYFFNQDKKPPIKAQVARKASLIIEWVNKKSVSNSELVKSCDALKNDNANDHGLISVYTGAPEGDLYDVHIALSLNWQMSSKWTF